MFYRVRSMDRLVLIHNAPSGKSISPDDARMVGDYLLRRERPEYGRASEYFARSGELGKQLDCLREATEANGIEDDELSKVLACAIDGTLKHSDWRNLISTLTRGQPKESTSSPKRRRSKTSENDRSLKLLAQAEMPWKQVIPHLAKSQALSDDTGQEKQQVQEYLKRLVGNQDWRKHVHPAVMGAAIERAGKDIDALVFYEDWRDRGSRSDEKRYVQVRWVVCKLRQADRQNSPSMDFSSTSSYSVAEPGANVESCDSCTRKPILAVREVSATHERVGCSVVVYVGLSLPTPLGA